MKWGRLHDFLLCSTRRRISKPSCVNNSTYYIIYKHNGVYIDRVYICPTAKRMEPPRKRKIKFRYGLTNEFRASRITITAHSWNPFPITCTREFCMLFHPFVTFSPPLLCHHCVSTMLCEEGSAGSIGRDAQQLFLSRRLGIWYLWQWDEKVRLFMSIC